MGLSPQRRFRRWDEGNRGWARMDCHKRAQRDTKREWLSNGGPEPNRGEDCHTGELAEGAGPGRFEIQGDMEGGLPRKGTKEHKKGTVVASFGLTRQEFGARNLLLRKGGNERIVMKTTIKRGLLAIITMVNLTGSPARAELEVSATVQIHATAEFEAPLTAHGAWVEVGSYGRCWRPAHVVAGWRPYCAGEWVWTDCGWYWQSDEPWAWACYHYGCWAYEPAYGWVWVPGVEWAPAWVSWRVGGGFIGWAPVPPSGRIFARHAAPEAFVFVGTAHFGERVTPGAVIVRNTTIFRMTTESGGVKRESVSFAGASAQKVMVNHGPSVEMVQKSTGRSFAVVSAREISQRTTTRGPSNHGESVRRVLREKDNPELANDRGPDRGDGAGRDGSGSSGGERERGGHGGGGPGKH
jgi:hypothetical protein